VSILVSWLRYNAIYKIGSDERKKIEQLILDYKIKLLDKGYQAYLVISVFFILGAITSTSGNSFAVFLGRRGEYF